MKHRNPLTSAFWAMAAIIAIAFGTLLGACTTTPGSTAPSFNVLAANADLAVQVVQKSSTAALRANKISVTQDQNIQAQVKLVHESILTAKSIQSSNPTQATIDLTAALAQLDSLKTRTGATAP